MSLCKGRNLRQYEIPEGTEAMKGRVRGNWKLGRGAHRQHATFQVMMLVTSPGMSAQSLENKPTLRMVLAVRRTQ
jgi:hypothetical protein